MTLDPVELFNDALELPVDKRDAWLRMQCGDDPALYAKLQDLLAAHDATSVEDAPLPEELGKYKIRGVLGKGAMGIVLDAEDRELGRRVALKVLPSDFSKNLGAVARLRREAQALARLGHPRIATLYSLEQVDGRDFITMEAIRGRTLQEWIGAPLPTSRAIAIAIQIADALDAAHRAGVIHKDLKPANVMILEDGSVKVVDFGIAALMEEGPKPT
ncbi:MAG TPA: serine/threonine-protein kinase, partial [bacterium]|nr:serine/threonine-protein kinase [bacterium]